ncbi:MAG: hypothetical protein HZB99_00255 [Candidatus Harrisonbacteria bacterium]|nr:hypothetical protein [Candidatus Harrisonbacteria bacterium]
MKKISLAVISLTVLSAQPIYASAKDDTRLGYLSLSAQGDANFSDDRRSFSSNSGVGLSVMFHNWEKDRKDKLVNVFDSGIDYTHFKGKMRSRTAPEVNFSLNNIIANMRIGLVPGFYFEGGYGLSVLNADNTTVGGCWKWGFGIGLNLFKSMYVNVEMSRWDGPGPVGFWSPNLGLEYHF